MQVAEPRSWAELIASTGDIPQRLLAHPDGRPGTSSSSLSSASFPRVALAIGPEGGFSAEEVALALAAGWQPVALGARILRVETAAIFLVASVVAAL
jgi:16S rRNA (uracil1498-N3)-methyltransferase